MDQIRKKREILHDEIRREAIQKKKNQVRRQLPYYSTMFRDSDDSSSGSNSRSSKFPARNNQIREGTNQINEQYQQHNDSGTFGEFNEAEYYQNKRQKTILYLESATKNWGEQRKDFIENQMNKKFGNDCFSDVIKLIDEAQFYLIQYQLNLKEIKEKENFWKQEKITREEWNFVLACYFLGENEKSEELIMNSLSILSMYFSRWYQDVYLMHRKSNVKQPFQIFQKKFEAYENLEVEVDVIIISFLLSVLQQQSIVQTQSAIDICNNYFNRKLDAFLEIEDHLQKFVTENEIQNISEIVFNFQWAYAFEKLSETVCFLNLDDYRKLNVEKLLNRFFSQYPMPQNQSPSYGYAFDMFKKLMTPFSKQFKDYVDELSFHVKRHSFDNQLVNYFLSALFMIKSLSRHDFNDQNEIMLSILKTYGTIMDMMVNTSIVENFIEHSQFHIQVIDCAIIIFASIQNTIVWLQEINFFDYLRILFLKFRKMKKDVSLIDCVNRNINSLRKLEIYLIEGLQLFETCIELIDGQQTKKECSQFMEVAKQFYIEEKESIKKRDFRKVLFIDERNVDFFFEMIGRQFSFNASNPENLNNSNFEQIEI